MITEESFIQEILNRFRRIGRKPNKRDMRLINRTIKHIINYLRERGVKIEKVKEIKDWKGVGYILTCKYCGRKKAYESKSVAPKNFCSNKCKAENYWSKRERGKFVNCYNCGNQVWLPLRYSKQKIKEGRFCDYECFTEYRRKNVPKWLKGNQFTKGKAPWNKNKKYPKWFKNLKRKQTTEKWKDLSFREKQMKRDFSKLHEGGRKYREKLKAKGLRVGKGKGTGKAVRKKFFEKMGVNLIDG